MWPPPSNSDHQDYLGNPNEPSFTTVTGRGPHPRYMYLITNTYIIQSWSSNETRIVLETFDLKKMEL